MRRSIFLFLIFILGFALRGFWVSNNPPSLYWDEASLGYNAFSIASSGYDEHGEYLPVDRFIAFGDYKPPGYIYAEVPFIWFLGANELAIRLPSVLAGSLMVIIAFYLTKQLFNSSKNKLPLIASFLTAVSPWSIQLSRAAFEANLAALFNMLGIYFFLSARKNKYQIILSILMFVLSFYTFNANRIIAPLMLIGLVLLNFKTIISNYRWVMVAFIIGVIMMLPSQKYLLDRESKLRFQEVSIFNNLKPVELANSRIDKDGGIWWAKLIHNRRLLYLSDFFRHYADNFTGRFMFAHGDNNPRLAIQEMGELYFWDLPFLLIGIYFVLKYLKKNVGVILLWLLVVPIPASMARETPHALRIASILPLYQIIIAYGLYEFLNWKRLAKIFSAVLVLLLSANIYYYLHLYHIHYPRDWSGEWQYGYKQMVEYVIDNQNKYENIFVTKALGRPYIYFALYGQYSAADFQKMKNATRDWYGFWEVSKLGKIDFDLSDISRPGRSLVVIGDGKLPDGYKLIKTINNLRGEIVFQIADR